MAIIGSTKNCISCGKPAKIRGGHIHKGKDTILAGWCKRHSNCEGCCGGWKKRDGFRKKPFDDN